MRPGRGPFPTGPTHRAERRFVTGAGEGVAEKGGSHDEDAREPAEQRDEPERAGILAQAALDIGLEVGVIDADVERGHVVGSQVGDGRTRREDDGDVDAAVTEACRVHQPRRDVYGLYVASTARLDLARQDRETDNGDFRRLTPCRRVAAVVRVRVDENPVTDDDAVICCRLPRRARPRRPRLASAARPPTIR